MDLKNDFTVDVPIDRAWAVLTDVETIAPCLPGAQLKEIEGDEYRGVVKVKVGPITAQYKGAARFVEQDEAAGKVVLKAEGRDTRGQGNANALITAQLEPAGERATRVVVTTDLSVTGKVAQFGRGVMADVSANLMAQFAENLASTVLAPGASEPAATEPAAEPADVASAETPAEDASGSNGSEPKVRVVDQPEAEPVDLMAAAGSPVMRRAVPPFIVLVILFLIWRAWRRRV
jgi:carbon monoxide dehydrogenase subunit G